MQHLYLTVGISKCVFPSLNLQILILGPKISIKLFISLLESFSSCFRENVVSSEFKNAVCSVNLQMKVLFFSFSVDLPRQSLIITCSLCLLFYLLLIPLKIGLFLCTRKADTSKISKITTRIIFLLRA